MNDQEQNERVIDQFTRQAAGYARLTAHTHAARSANPLALIGARPDDIALDVACGAGGLTLPLAAMVRHMTGVDLTPAMIDEAKLAQQAKGIATIDWRIEDAQALSFDDASFSLVVCGAAFHHFADPGRVLAEMRRVCAAGGRMAVMDVTPPAAKSAAFDAIEHRRDPSHVHALTPAELRNLGVELGLSEIAFEQCASPTLPLDPVLASSCPTECSIDEIHDLYRADALSGDDAFGLAATLVDDRIFLSYPISLAVWRR
jgi:ubiquinone/menaquinone biosynthesis C-methylase UbiE